MVSNKTHISSRKLQSVVAQLVKPRLFYAANTSSTRMFDHNEAMMCIGLIDIMNDDQKQSTVRTTELSTFLCSFFTCYSR